MMSVYSLWANLAAALDAVEAEIYHEAYIRANKIKSQAAKLVGVSRSTFVKKFNIHFPKGV